jgi:hypothetical protein
MWTPDRIFLLFELTLVAFAMNLPFGHLRAPTKKFSVAWFLYIHLPIPAIIFMRKIFDFDWKVIPLMIAAAIAGQVIGSRLNRKACMAKKARENIN